MNRRPYAGEITKEYLKKLGIEYVSLDGTVIIKNGAKMKISVSEKTKKPYGVISVYDPDFRQSTSEDTRTRHSGCFPLGVHIINYVWNIADKPAGMVIDHRDNDPTNNDISNLQCITPSENLHKERPDWNTFELKCKLNKPRSFYEQKLAKYTEAYEQAKKDHDAEAAHKLRCNISHSRARLRYYDSHIEEARAFEKATQETEEKKREYHERAQRKKELKHEVGRARQLYKELLDAYGKEDSIVVQYYDKWKLAVAMYHGFCNKTTTD